VNRAFFSTHATPVALVFVAILTLTGCSSPREYFALASDSGTPVGAMQIQARNDATAAAPFTLDAKNPVAVRQGAGTRAASLDAAELHHQFKAALSAQPLPPARFTLYFSEGGDTLTAESQTAVTAILDEIKQRPAPDLVVVGHTDRVGALRDNDKLSSKRAESIRQQLVLRGIDADNIQASGRGERQPLVPTADEVAEPRNRRVEILVR
jgi:outer membrane protein OmpA-like peptidoglycan-associated protein